MNTGQQFSLYGFGENEHTAVKKAAARVRSKDTTYDSVYITLSGVYGRIS
ncbi:hypothetical protein OXPF_37640 [Oxobacter pfennigii]|uniref:Uncharacterized protein n=1 Tax=Oxobacter pfennigii TaxID=36849 RepID=A0A0P8WWQ5_9CLOT|nr:hypothetical protein [Oxobacter pfennigii]KPU42710.1 hypothetical protein OXPF_37640 [Oxobacter pfennigii]